MFRRGKAVAEERLEVERRGGFRTGVQVLAVAVLNGFVYRPIENRRTLSGLKVYVPLKRGSNFVRVMRDPLALVNNRDCCPACTVPLGCNVCSPEIALFGHGAPGAVLTKGAPPTIKGGVCFSSTGEFAFAGS